MVNKVEVSGYVTLFIGVGLLIFTFVSSYLFLTKDPSIKGSSDLVTVFGEGLAPLIVTCIRVMYLGVMGWIGSLLTIRGVQLITQLKREVKPEVKPTAPATLETPIPKTTETQKTEKTGKNNKVKDAK